VGLFRSVTASLCLLCFSSFSAFGQSQRSARIAENGIPIVFEPAPSQISGPVAMTGRLHGATIAWEPQKVQLQLDGGRPGQLEVGFVGASATIPHGSSLAASQSNYLLGNDPSRWRTHVPNYRQVVYSKVYPGIDAVFYGHGQLLEHDFIISPGADYRQIRLHLSADAHKTLEKNGDLTIALPAGKLRMHKPVIYQDLPGGRRQRSGGFHVLAGGDISFIVRSYDPRRTLVIDPVLSFSTYLSSQATDLGGFIATDSSGNSYVTGIANLGFPQTPGALPGCGTCTTDEIVTYVSKLSPDGKTLIYSTLIGGNGYTQSNAIAADANGNAVVTGRTQATDFPVKNGQTVGPSSGGFYFGFLASLSADGSSLNYGTLLGGTVSGQHADTEVTAITLDTAGNAYIGGDTGSTLYPYTAGALNNGPPSDQGSQVFLSKFGPTGNLAYSAFLGVPDIQAGTGGGGPTGVNALAVDTAGDVYVAGAAGTLWPTTSGVYLQQNSGTQPFLAKVAAGGGSFVYSTLLPPSVIVGVVALTDGSVFVAGYGAPSTYPTTANAYQAASTALNNSVLTEVNPSGSDLVYSTFFGDATYDLSALAADTDGDLWVAGRTQGFTFPLVTPLQSVLPITGALPPTASTLSQFDPTGTTLKFSTFLGGAAYSLATSLAIDGNHRAHVAGTAGSGLYTTSGAYLASVPPPGPSYSTEMFPYVALVDPNAPAAAVCIKGNNGPYWQPVTAGSFADQPVTITNCGTLPLTISGIVPAAAVFTVPAAENGCTETVPVGQSCTLSVRYSPTAAETDTSTLTIQSNASIAETVLPLSGTGVVPKIQVISFVQFAFTLVGQTSSSQLLIQNVGGAPLTLNAANTRASGDFSLQGLGSCSAPIPGGSGGGAGACLLPIYFTPTAPGSRSGTLQIASNDPTTPTLTVALQATGYPTAPVPQITSVGSQLLPAGVAQTGFPVQGFDFSPNSVVEINGVPQATTYMSEDQLAANLAASSIPANQYGEFTLTVVTPGPGGGQSAPVTLTEYQTLSTQNSYLLYEPVSKQLFASIPAASTTNPNTVLPINPVTVAAGTPIAVGNDPGVLAASSDGAYLYVALNGGHSIQRINLSTLAIERTFALPVDMEAGQLQVGDMHVVPGNSTELVASLIQPQVDPAAFGVALFNDAGLVNWIGPNGDIPDVNSVASDIYNFAFTDPGTIWGVSAYSGIFNELTVSPSGVATTTTTCCGADVNLASDGTLIYSDFGLVWNPATGKQVAAYAIGIDPFMNSVIPDAGTGKTYFLNAFPPLNVVAFDQASLAQTASLVLGSWGLGTPFSGTQMVRWGGNGFAMRTFATFDPPTTGFLLFTSSITEGSNLVGTPVASTLAPASTPAGEGDFTLTVTGSGFVSGSTVEWNGSPRSTTMVSSTQLTSTIYASDIATEGTAQITVVNPGNGGGISGQVTFTIGAPAPPPPPAAPVVTITPASLTFAAQTVNVASAPQTVSVKNSGNADLTGLTIAVSGSDAASFAETNNCGATVSAGSSCTASVVFTPAATGALSATITVTDNAANSPQSVALSGTGAQPTFTITPQPGGSASATVTAGKPATYALSLSPSAGYSGNVTLSCSGLPANASCSFSPATLALSDGKAAGFALTVATEATQTSMLPALGVTLGGFLLLLPLALRKGRREVTLAVSIGLLFVASGLWGCGSGSSGTTPTQPGGPTVTTVAPGTYTIQVVASDGTTTQKMPVTLAVGS
jgi:hypothetical protein